MKPKFKSQVRFAGRVGDVTLHATGRTKREATLRLRHLFAERGMPTKPEIGTDRLDVFLEHQGVSRHKKPSRVLGLVAMAATIIAGIPGMDLEPLPDVAPKRRVVKPSKKEVGR